jgi:hypothetical protein
MNRKVLTYAIVPVLGVTALGIGFASAHGGWMGTLDPSALAERFQARFEHQAEILGIDADTLKDAWAEGKRLPEIAEEHGISVDELRERMRAEHQLRMRERMAVLVSEGVLTQAQADERMATMQEHREQRPDEFPGKGIGHRTGFGRGFGF